MSEIKSPSIKLKVSQNVEAASTQPKYARYATRLKQMDKDGDGTIDMDEMCEAIDQMVEREKQNSLLKKVACVTLLTSLLTIAAVVGLVAAVVIESEELSSSDNVITSPGGDPLYVSLPSLTANMSDTASRRRHLLADGGCNPQPEEWGSVDIESLNNLCKALEHDAGLQLAISMASDDCKSSGDSTCTSRTMLQVDGESCATLASPPACGDTSTWTIVTGYDGKGYAYTIAVERTCPDNSWNRPVITRSCDSSSRPLTNSNSTDGISIEATQSCGAVDVSYEIEKGVQQLKPDAVKTAKVKAAVAEQGIGYWASIPRSTIEYWCKCQASASNELGRSLLVNLSDGEESTGQEIQFDSAVCNETVKSAAQLEILAFVKRPKYSTQAVVQCLGNAKTCKVYSSVVDTVVLASGSKNSTANSTAKPPNTKDIVRPFTGGTKGRKLQALPSEGLRNTGRELAQAPTLIYCSAFGECVQGLTCATVGNWAVCEVPCSTSNDCSGIICWRADRNTGYDVPPTATDECACFDGACHYSPAPPSPPSPPVEVPCQSDTDCIGEYGQWWQCVSGLCVYSFCNPLYNSANCQYLLESGLCPQNGGVTPGTCICPVPGGDEQCRWATPSGPDCFPGDSVVTLLDGSLKTMAELKVGDTVQVVNTKTGALEFSEVYAFLDYKTAALRNYINIGVQLNNATTSKTLKVTGNHFVYYSTANKASSAAADISKARMIHAKKVKVGDTMWVALGSAGKAVAGTVTEISHSPNVGAYAPQTLAGIIVVDGVVAHSAADIELANGIMLSDAIGVPPEWYIGTAPLKWLYRVGLLNSKFTMAFINFQVELTRVWGSMVSV